MIKRTKLLISIIISALVLALVGVISFYIYENQTNVKNWYNGNINSSASDFVKDNDVLVGIVDRSITKVTAKDLEGVTVIGESAFLNCTNLKEIELPESVTVIGDSAFSGCSSLQEVKLPEGVISIQDDAFNYCSSLMSISLPSTLIEIGTNAFYNCDRLVELFNFSDIEIVAGDTSTTNGRIGKNLLKVHDKQEESCIRTINSSKYLVDENSKIFLFSDDVNATTFEIDANTTEIANSAFKGFENLSSINIPNTITKIGASAFANCSSLTSFTFPASLTTVGTGAFNGCNNLIELYNFSEIPVTAGSTANSNVNGAIGRNLLKVHDKQEESCVKVINNVKYFVDEDKKIILGAINKDVTTFAFENDATEIYQYAFEGNTYLTTIDIPSSVTKIGNYAFRNCTNLTEIKLHEGLTEIGNNAFSNCESLESLFLPSTITSGTISVISNLHALKELRVDSVYVYTRMLSAAGLRNLPTDCKIYVLKTIVDNESNTNTALNSYTKTESENYYLYTNSEV